MKKPVMQVRIDSSLQQLLGRQAKQNRRSVASEVNFILWHYLKANRKS